MASLLSLQNLLTLGGFYCIIYTIKNKGEDKLSFGTDIISSVRQYARKFTVNEIDLKKEIEKEIKLATKYKEEQIINIKGIYKAFLESNKSHFDKAISILR